MHQDGTDAAVHAGHHALRLAQAVGADHRAHAVDRVPAPPRVDLVEDQLRLFPTVDGQSEGAFGDERVAAHGFEGIADAVRMALVVAGGHPHFAFVFHAHLGAARDMPCRMQAETHFVDGDGLAVTDAFDLEVGSDAGVHQGLGYGRGQVIPAATARMITVGMGDDGTINPAPRIDVHIGDGAVDATRGECQ